MRLSQFAAVWMSVFVIFAFVLLYNLTDYQYSKFIADWFAMIGLSFMMASTTPVAWRAFKNGISTDQDRFIFSYWLIWTVIFFQRVWIIVVAQMGRPPELIYSMVPGLLATAVTIAAGYGASAPLSGELPIHRREQIILIAAVGFSGVIAGILIGVYVQSGWAE